MMPARPYLQLLSGRANKQKIKIDQRLISELSYDASSIQPSICVWPGNKMSEKEFTKGSLASSQIMTNKLRKYRQMNSEIMGNLSHRRWSGAGVGVGMLRGAGESLT